MIKAVVDVGSNSVLLLVSELRDGRWLTIYEASRVTGLGTGTKQTGVLSEEGISKTLTALDEMRRDALTHGGVEPLYAVTMAARIARNTPDFLERAQKQGTPVMVLSGEHEAELGFLAVADDPTFLGHDRLSIIDPGGQSTEIVTADRIWHQPAGAVEATSSWQVRFRKSFPVGALGLRETHLQQPAPDLMARFRASAYLDEMFDLEYGPGESGCVVALGATGTNLISIRERLESWQPERVHGAPLDYEEISRAVGWMMDMTDEERAAIPGIEPGRERTLHIGCLILERGLYALKAESCTVSVRGWRHALLERGLPTDA